MSNPYMSEIRLFPYPFAPKGWALCNGQILSIQQNAALFSLLGTTYGGDGIRTFQLPNLQGRVPISFGNGQGLSPYVLGEIAGVENVTLLISDIPAHTHTFNATSMASSVTSPSASLFGDNTGGSGAQNYINFVSASPLDNAAVGIGGGSLPHENRQPYLVMNFCIALVGIFPSRN